MYVHLLLLLQSQLLELFLNSKVLSQLQKDYFLTKFSVTVCIVDPVSLFHSYLLLIRIGAVNIL